MKWSDTSMSIGCLILRFMYLKTKLRLICLKFTRDLPHGRGCLPWRWQVPTTILQGAVQLWWNVSNHIRSRWPLMMHHPGQGKAGRTLVSALPLKNWTQADLPKTHRGPSPRQGLPPLKTASPYHHPSRSSTSASKCAKSRQELPAEKWSLPDLHKTHRGPAPWWEQYPLKTEGPYLKPPWSSAGWCKWAKSCQEPLAIDDAPPWAGQGWKDPCLSSSPEKLNSGWSAQKSQGPSPW